MPESMLGYESNRYDALEPGEQLLWEGAPTKWPALWPICIRGAIITILPPVVMIWLATALTWDLTILAAIVSGCWPILAGLRYAKTIQRRREFSRRTYRITDRRLLSGHPMKKLSTCVHAVELRFVVKKVTPGCATMTFIGGGHKAVFERLADSSTLEAIILSIPERTARRLLLRRGGHTRGKTQSMSSTEAHPPESDLPLQAGEILIWSGQPRIWDPIDRSWWMRRFRILAWTVIPLAGVVFCIHVARQDPYAPAAWIFMVISALWLWGSFHSLFIAPFRVASRRRRSRYYLTNIRAVTELRQRGGRRSIHSYFLDLAGGARLEISPDGFGTVSLDRNSCHFEAVENVTEVHRQLIEAIRSCGGERQTQ